MMQPISYTRSEWRAGLNNMSNTEFDVVVIGSGGAGLTCATVAQQQGLRCLVIEKAGMFGGTTAYSGGGVWIPCNPHMADIGQEDSRSDAEAYLSAVLGNHYDADLVGAFLDSGAEMVRYMEDNTHVRFFSIPLSDYQPDLPGAKLGRTMLTQEYDGSPLGDWLRKVRLPFLGYVAFGSMQTDPQHLGKFRNAFRTPEGFLFSARRFSAFVLDLLRFGRGANMANGNALVGRLLRSALDAGVTLWESSPAIRLMSDDGGVTGVVVKRDGREFEIRAERGVVLASGGFGANPAMVEQYMPMPGRHVSISPESNEGDGLAMAQAVGGALPPPNPDNGIWAPVSHVHDATGKVISKFPHFGPDRGKPGTIIVTPDGKRFGNEASPYQDFVNVMHERGIDTAWLIADHRMLRNYGLGIALPAPLPYRKYVRSGYLIRGRTIAELADKIGMDPSALETTVQEFNRHAARGADPVFHRGESIYDNAQGDFGHQPNPNLAPVEHAPFYAVKIHPGNVSTLYGMNTTADAQVLDARNNPIGGLYAIGLDQNAVTKGFYPGGGSSIGPGMTFAYRAAMRMARENGSKRSSSILRNKHI
ncbi:MAG: FAD-dependent oxidoreductase [Caenibius sp.]